MTAWLRACAVTTRIKKDIKAGQSWGPGQQICVYRKYCQNKDEKNLETQDYARSLKASWNNI